MKLVAILTGLTLLFFYQTIFFGKIPFPGDILASDFQPWRSTSYLGYGAGGIPNKAQYPDVIRQIYPWKTLVVDSLKHGKFPLWNPYNFSGAPLLANFQSAALYPFNIFYLLFSQIDAWTILIILQPLLATFFTYLYCKKIGIGSLGSWLAALSYGFSGFMAVWLEYNTIGHVILWLPILLLAIESKWFLLIAFGNAAALLAGHPQVYAYMLFFTLCYTLFRVPYKIPVFVFTALGIGVAGVQLIPGAELIANAARSPHDPKNLFEKILIQPWQLLNLPFPNIFGNPATRTYWPTDTFVGKVTTIGLVPLFFLFSALRRKGALTKFFVVSSGIVVLLITANPVTYLLYRLPTASSPTLMSFLLAFSLSVLCGMGLDFWMTDKHSIKKLIRRSIEVGALLTMMYFLRNLGLSSRAILYATIISGATLGLFWVAIRFPKFRAHAITILLVVHILDLFFFFQRFNPFVPKALVFPDHPILTFLKKKSPDRFWGYGTGRIDSNFATQYGIFSPEGYDPLYPKRYAQFMHGTRSDASVESHFGDGGIPNKLGLLNAVSVRYLLDRTENGTNAQIPSAYKNVFSYDDWNIYENPNAKPRTYLDTGTAIILTYEPERIAIETESTLAGQLTITDTYYPGWIATIDNQPVSINQSGAFRAVSVPTGKHTVIMTYNPKSVIYGLIASLISIGITLFVCLKKPRFLS